MARFVSHLESAIDGTHFEPNQLLTLHEGRPLWVRYDLDQVKKHMSKADVVSRPADLWRYRELLPVGDEIQPVSFGEGMSPVLHCPRLGDFFGLKNVWVKDESQLPGGSFKSRGLTMAITMAKHFGVQQVAIPTAGNAGGATALYAARAGMESIVLMPKDTPEINQLECFLAGAKTFLVDVMINACGKISGQAKEKTGWFDLSTLKEPYRIEGKKTMGLELAEFFQWKLPDVILYPTGGGTGLIGMWKAFKELREMGWLDSDNMPRMVSVQSSGCCPIVRAFEQGERFAEPFENAETIASGLRVPVAVGDFMILDSIRESGGTAIAAEETELNAWQGKSIAMEGISICPETAACIAALKTLRDKNWLQDDEKVVIFNTGAAQKYVEAVPFELPSLDKSQDIETLISTIQAS